MPRRADAVHGRLAAHQAAAGREVQRASIDGPAVAGRTRPGRGAVRQAVRFFERHAVPLDVARIARHTPTPPMGRAHPGPHRTVRRRGARRPTCGAGRWRCGARLQPCGPAPHALGRTTDRGAAMSSAGPGTFSERKTRLCPAGSAPARRAMTAARASRAARSWRRSKSKVTCGWGLVAATGETPVLRPPTGETPVLRRDRRDACPTPSDRRDACRYASPVARRR